METQLKRAFDYPFRIFFLSTSIWAMVVMMLWVAVMSGALHYSFPLPALHWHQHEMLYGFVSPAIAGFLLTAVCVWTNTERLHGVRLLLLWLVWLMGRVVMLINPGVPEFVLVSINLVFLPLVLLDAGLRVWKVRQRRQYGLIVLVGLYWVTQIGFLLTDQGYWSEAAIITLLMIMAVIGGRITPAFSATWLTKQGLSAEGVCTYPRLDQLALGSSLLLCAALPVQNSLLTGALALVAGSSHLARIVAWRGWRVKAEPLLWILHLSFLWIPAALLLLAAGKFDLAPVSTWVHAAGAGAIASLILGIMARVSLGHTGRPLVLPAGLVVAFILVQAAAILRVATSAGQLEWRLGISITAACWVLAFAIYLGRYTAILLSPRVDGRPG